MNSKSAGGSFGMIIFSMIFDWDSLALLLKFRFSMFVWMALLSESCGMELCGADSAGSLPSAISLTLCW